MPVVGPMQTDVANPMSVYMLLSLLQQYIYAFYYFGRNSSKMDPKSIKAQYSSTGVLIQTKNRAPRVYANISLQTPKRSDAPSVAGEACSCRHKIRC